MFCGTSSFHRFAADDDPLPPKCSTKKKKKKRSKNKNPYSSRGLDKFTSVLSELEARREKIMANTGAQGIAMIRFMYSNSQDWIPIVVRLPDGSNKNNDNNHQVVPVHAAPSSSSPKKPEETASTSPPLLPPAAAAAINRFPWWKWRSAYCLPLMMVLILVCLVIFGRVFAICCTSIWWYLVPTLQGEEDGRMRRGISRKKDYVNMISHKRPPAAAGRAAPAPGKTTTVGVKDLASPITLRNNGKKG